MGSLAMATAPRYKDLNTTRRREVPPDGWNRNLLEGLAKPLQYCQFSRQAARALCHWVKRYCHFDKLWRPDEMAEPYINAFLAHLAAKERVSASPQNKALSALLFLYRHVPGREVGDLGEVIRACKPKRLPVVMTRDEVKAVLANLTGDKGLMASMMYGAGLRLMECQRLRVQDLDFTRNEILVRDGKGAKDRVTRLPESVKAPLQEHLKQVMVIHERDLRAGVEDCAHRRYRHVSDSVSNFGRTSGSVLC